MDVMKVTETLLQEISATVPFKKGDIVTYLDDGRGTVIAEEFIDKEGTRWVPILFDNIKEPNWRNREYLKVLKKSVQICSVKKCNSVFSPENKMREFGDIQICYAHFRCIKYQSNIFLEIQEIK